MSDEGSFDFGLEKLREGKTKDDLRVDPSSTPGRCCNSAAKLKLFNFFFLCLKSQGEKKIHDEFPSGAEERLHLAVCKPSKVCVP